MSINFIRIEKIYYIFSMGLFLPLVTLSGKINASILLLDANPLKEKN